MLAQLKAYVHWGREGVSGKRSRAVTFGIFKRLSIGLVSKRTAVLTFINDTRCWWLVLNYCDIWSPVSVSGLPSRRQSGMNWRRSSPACVWAGITVCGWPREWGIGKWVRSAFPLMHKWKLFFMVRVVRQQNSLPREAADSPPFKIFKTLLHCWETCCSCETWGGTRQSPEAPSNLIDSEILILSSVIVSAYSNNQSLAI